MKLFTLTDKQLAEIINSTTNSGISCSKALSMAQTAARENFLMFDPQFEDARCYQICTERLARFFPQLSHQALEARLKRLVQEEGGEQ
jgi:hypothetical protein